MTIYFVRHGESVNNLAKKYQGPEVLLSENGETQAKFVGERFQNIQIDRLLSSTYIRTQQTAQAISEVTGKEIELLDTLIERKRPSSFSNRPYDDPELEKIRELIDSHPDPDHHHSDEENFFDVKKRAEAVIKFLESCPEQSIAVVSHGIFIQTILMSMLLQESFTLDNFLSSNHVLETTNTGISVCEYKENGKWRIKTINDIAHLAERETVPQIAE